MSPNNVSRNKCTTAAGDLGGARLGTRNAIVLDRKLYAYCYNPTQDAPDCRQYYIDDYQGLIWEHEGMLFKIPHKDLTFIGDRTMNGCVVKTARLKAGLDVVNYLVKA